MARTATRECSLPSLPLALCRGSPSPWLLNGFGSSPDGFVVGLKVTPTHSGFGALISGAALCKPLSASLLGEIRHAWLKHQVVSFADQPLSPEELEQFTLQLGEFGVDPYVKPLIDHQHILEVRREPHEAVPPFGSGWHSDWSFQREPPAATILHAKVVPSIGGDTLFADGYAALATLDPVLRDLIQTLTAIHSARRPYSHQGYRASGGDQRTMQIRPSDSALATQEHPVVRTHPETGRQALWINPSYTIAIKGLCESDSSALLGRLFDHCHQARFVYRLRWTANMLTLWDNRCVTHRAEGGYDGQRRLMHRITIAGDPPEYIDDHVDLTIRRKDGGPTRS